MSYQNFAALFSKQDRWAYLILGVLLVVVLPLSVDIFRLNLIGKYL